VLENPVREAAEVFLNGTRVGSVWAPPFELNIAGFLHAGNNTLEIRVTNTAINALDGNSPPDYRALIERFGERFLPPTPTDQSPLPSGLLGPVTLDCW
jgi:hypothetical protein